MTWVTKTETNMTSIRQYISFGIQCRRVFLSKYLKTNINPMSALMHNSRIVLDDHTLEIKMPSLSPTMTEGTILKWLKKEGDPISPGDVLCEIETDKAVVGFETEEEGVLSKILVSEATKNIQLGEIIAVMIIDGDSENGSSKTKVSDNYKVESKIEKTEVIIDTIDKEKPRLCGPSVRNLLQEYGIKYTLVTRSGPHNNLIKGDVLSYIQSNKLKPQVQVHKELEIIKTPDVTFVEKPYIDIPNTSMRKAIAKRLTESKTKIPHAYMSAECTVNKVLQYKNQLKSNGIIVSVNDFVIKCVAVALSRIPEANVVQINDQPKRAETVDISIAVATEKGLITPIVKNADCLNIQEISEEVKSLVAKAREGKLQPNEFQGGTFTISNLGMFGISEFSAVINPPQGAILAVGTSRLVLENELPVTRMTVTLSYDGRIIDDNKAGLFLQCFKKHFENPFSMVV